MTREIDMESVICAEADLALDNCRGFVVGTGPWPLRGFVLRTPQGIRAYVNTCPHAGHPLNLKPDGFLTVDGSLIVCSSHGALFEKATGYCVDGPCAGRSLTPLGIRVEAGYVFLDDDRAAEQVF